MNMFVIERAKPEDAAALLEKILTFAEENGFEQLNLEVRSDNVRAIRLYEKFGFQKLCTFPAFFKLHGQGIDFDLMNRNISTGRHQEMANEEL